MKNACEKGYSKILSDAYAELINTSINNIDYYIDNISNFNNTVKNGIDEARDESLNQLIASRTKFDTLQ